MIVDFRLPHLGDGIVSADIIKIPIKEGEQIKADQVLVEIETDKATVEVPSDVSGVVKKIFVKEGSKAAVGEALISIEVLENGESGAEKNSSSVETSKIETPAPAPIPVSASIPSSKPGDNEYEFRIPALGENISSAQITKVLVKPGDTVSVDQIVLEIETDKATVEIPSEVAGKIKKVFVKDGEKVGVGSAAFTMEIAAGAESKSAIAPSKKAEPEKANLSIDEEPAVKQKEPFQKVEHSHAPSVVNLPKDFVRTVVPAAPSVRRFAREIGINIQNVRGTGPNGRISNEDVKAFAKSLNEKLQTGASVSGATGAFAEPLPDFSKWGDVERRAMTNIRRKTAEHLSFAWSSVPHVTQFDKADITELEKLRKQFGKKVEDAGGKLTVTAVLVKVLASALKVFPQFNSSVDMERSEIVYKKFVNIGIAVDTDRGLLVPVIRDADKKNIIQLSVELQEISKRARDKKLSPDEMQGGCFTVSNLGGIGGTYFTPIVNSPEVAIIGVSKSSYEPVFIDNKFEPRLMMPLSLSYDHRIIDGADGIRFLRWVINALENPFLLSLEG